MSEEVKWLINNGLAVVFAIAVLYGAAKLGKWAGKRIDDVIYPWLGLQVKTATKIDGAIDGQTESLTSIKAILQTQVTSHGDMDDRLKVIEGKLDKVLEKLPK